MWMYVLLAMMAVFSCGFVEGDMYFKIYNVMICVVLASIYNMVVFVYTNILRKIEDLVNLLWSLKEENVVDSDRFDRMKKYLLDVPREDRSILFDCMENGYIILNSEGYAIFKDYPERTNNERKD